MASEQRVYAVDGGRRYWILPTHPRSAPMTTTPVSPDTRIPIFISLNGKVHKGQQYPWGRGTACSDKFLMGSATDGLVRDVTCEHCLAHDLPTTFEVRLPDRRYKSGYRVVHAGLSSREEAELLATRPDMEVVECLPAEVHSHGH